MAEEKDKALKQAYDHAAEILDMESEEQIHHQLVYVLAIMTLKNLIMSFLIPKLNQLIAVNSIEKDMEWS